MSVVATLFITLLLLPGSFASWKYVGQRGLTSGRGYRPSLISRPDGRLLVASQSGETSGSLSVLQKNPFSSTDEWRLLGTGIGSANGLSMSMAFDPSGSRPSLYVAFGNSAKSGKLAVRKYNANSNTWLDVSNGGDAISDGSVDATSMAIDPVTSNPYVAFRDGSVENRLSVVRCSFGCSGWEYVGGKGVSAAEINSPSLAFSSADSTPYIAFEDQSAAGQLSVMTYKSSASGWTYVCGKGISGDAAVGPSLAFSPANNAPYVAFQDTAASGKLSVVAFNSSIGSGEWRYVGTQGFSVGLATHPSLEFDTSTSNNFPFVAFSDGGVQDKISVLMYNASAPEPTPAPTNPSSGSSSLSFINEYLVLASTCTFLLLRLN